MELESKLTKFTAAFLACTIIALVVSIFIFLWIFKDAKGDGVYEIGRGLAIMKTSSKCNRLVVANDCRRLIPGSVTGIGCSDRILIARGKNFTESGLSSDYFYWVGKFGAHNEIKFIEYTREQFSEYLETDLESKRIVIHPIAEWLEGKIRISTN